MNKRGASIGVVFMFALLLFFFAFAIASSFNSSVQTTRTNMNCSTNFTNLAYGQKVVCTVSDLYSPFFIALILGMGGALVAIKLTQ